MLALSELILISVSLASEPPSAEQQRCCTSPVNPWRARRPRAAADQAGMPGDEADDERWSHAERWLALVLLGLTLLMVVWWR